MEDGDGISDNEVEFNPSVHETPEVEISEVLHGDILTKPHRITITYPRKDKEDQRVKKLENTVKDFLIAHAGIGLLRGSFGKLDKKPGQTLEQRLSNLEKSVEKFKLEGDGLNVSGSFDKGFTVNRQNPCPPPQESSGF